MTDRPIIFSGPMVQALLAGRKTQTRRILKGVPPAEERCPPKSQPKHPAPYVDAYCSEQRTEANLRGMSQHWCWWTADDRQCLPTFKVGYVPGDRLWVRENWQVSDLFNQDPPRSLPVGLPVQYAVGGMVDRTGYIASVGRVRPSMFMPRWASRLTLLVTDVRVERLQDISSADAQAEGVEQESADPPFYYVPGIWPHNLTAVGIEEPGGRHAERSFAKLWSHIHGPEAWAENPWVAAVSFAVEKRNIDEEVET